MLDTVLGALAIVLTGAIALAVGHQRDRYNLTIYLFFVRYPLLLGFLLLVFPLAGPAIAPESLDNLFVASPSGIALLVFFGCLAAWSIVYVFLLIWVSTPVRSRVSFHIGGSGARPGADVPDVLATAETEEGDAHGPRPAPSPAWPETGIPNDGLLSWPRAWASLILVAPLAFQLLRRGEGGVLSSIAGAGVGLAAALAVRLAHQLLGRVGMRGSGPVDRIARRIRARTGSFWLSAYRYHTREPRPHDLDGCECRDWYRLHARALLFAGLACGTYLGLGIVAFQIMGTTDWIPALAYLLALFVTLPWISGFLSFQFDTPRIPIVLWGVILLIAWQMILPARHQYRVEPWGDGRPPTAHEVLDRWSGDSAIVVAAASGGGISAALWSARVLTGLSTELGDVDFASRLAAVSAVSGGAVGSMYYVDGVANGASDDRILRGAGATSLDVLAWGLAYPDVARLALGDLLRDLDRGWALEERWAGRLQHPGARLSDWLRELRPGHRPLLVFNATYQETGERLVISPATLGNNPSAQRRDFLSSFPGSDLRVVSAARMSSTFPFVSPQARPAVPGEYANSAYHLSDGGYYDNSGLLTTLELIDGWLAATGFRGRIAVVEIIAGPEVGSLSSDTPDPGSLLNSWVGPLETLFEVREASQLARNATMIELYRDAWSHRGATLGHFTFSLSEAPPLSWQLTEAERRAIRAHWPTDSIVPAPGDTGIQRLRTANGRSIETLRDFLEDG